MKPDTKLQKAIDLCNKRKYYRLAQRLQSDEDLQAGFAINVFVDEDIPDWIGCG